MISESLTICQIQSHLLHGIQIPDPDGVIIRHCGHVSPEWIQRHCQDLAGVGSHHSGVTTCRHVKDAHIPLEASLTRQSVAVQRDGASPVDQKVPVITTPGMNF